MKVNVDPLDSTAIPFQPVPSCQSVPSDQASSTAAAPEVVTLTPTSTS